MSLLKPDYDAVLTLSPNATEQLTDPNYFAVTLENFVVYTAAFLNDGSTGVHEGIVTIRLSGNQVTTLPFRGEPTVPGEVDKKFLNKLLYLGPVRDRLFFEIAITESNQQTRDVLDGIANGLQTVGNFLPVVPAPVPVPVGPILALGSTVLHLISSNVKDVQECTTKLALCPDPKANAFLTRDPISFSCTRKVPVTTPPTVAPVIAVGNFKIQSFKPAAVDKSVAYVISLKNLSFNPIAGSNIAVLVPATVNSTKGPRPGYKYELKPAIDYVFRDMSSFNFEASSGSNKYSHSSEIVVDATGTPSIPDLLWESCELFSPTLSSGVIPFALSFTLNASKIQVDSINDALSGALAVAGSIGAKIPTAVVKEAPTALSILSDLSPENLTVYSMNGAVILNDDGSSPENPNGLLILPRTSPTSWERTITANDGSPLRINYNGQDIGTISFDLEVRAQDGGHAPNP